jgi:tetratricopeptide (TPR) repeat protein
VSGDSPCKGPHLLSVIDIRWLVLLAAFLAVRGSRSYSQTATNNQETASRMERSLARAQSAALERHYAEAIKILRAALREHPGEVALQLDLGRAYLATGDDGKAQRLFTEILNEEPGNRGAQLELARVLAYQRHYGQSDELYRKLLAANPGDEAAAIGLTSNLMHEGRRSEAAEIADAALHYHSNSLRLLEYKDRIAQGLLGGEERTLPVAGNVFSTATDYINDSAGNHSWRGTERLELRIKPGLTNDLHIEQAFLHSLDDSREVVETFSERVRWRPLERLALSTGGGAIRFDKGDVRAIYEAILTGQASSHLLLGAGFSRMPILPDAEAAEHQLTAQGWEAFSLWTPAHWQINLRGSRRHYTDGNIGEQEWAEAFRQWTTEKVDYVGGYRFRHYGFNQDVAHGYFSPDNYQSHQATLGAVFHPSRRYRGELTAHVGAESIASGAEFHAAWEFSVRNQLTLGHWGLNLDYSRYHMAQVTGAFKADAARFEFAYHF